MEDFEKEEELIWYLDKNYIVKEGVFLTKEGAQEWGFNLLALWMLKLNLSKC